MTPAVFSLRCHPLADFSSRTSESAARTVRRARLKANVRRGAKILAFAALWPIGAASAQEAAPSSEDTPPTPEETARSLIAMEARSFQRDLAAGDWNALLTHFWPAKFTARWAPPVGSDVWAGTSVGQRAPTGSGVSETELQCGGGQATIAIVGRWARVLLPSCAARPTELWMLEMNGRWKIAGLGLEAARAWARPRTSR